MKMKAVGYRVIVKPDELETISPGGIIYGRLDAKLHEDAQTYGVIVDIGPLAWRREVIGKDGEHAGKPWVKIGDSVQFSRYAGQPAKDDRGDLRVINDDDIVCKVED